MRLQTDRAEVVVPCTIVSGNSKNSVALALSAYDKVVLRATAGDSRIFIHGKDSSSPETQAEARSVGHAIVGALHAGLECVGAPLVGVEMRCDLKIPRKQGLGERTAGILIGLSAAQTFLGGTQILPLSTVIKLALQLGASPARAAAALHGGSAINWSGDPLNAVALKPPPLVNPTVFLPQYLPERVSGALADAPVPFRDAADSNVQGALLGVLLSGLDVANNSDEFLSLLFAATENSINLQSSKSRVPASAALTQWLREKKLPAFVCGNGPAVVSLSTPSSEICRSAESSGWTVAVLPVSSRGATIIESGISTELLNT